MHAKRVAQYNVRIYRGGHVCMSKYRGSNLRVYVHRRIRSSCHGAELSSRRAFLSCGVWASSSSALRFSAALGVSGAGAGAFFFFFTTIDVRSLTGKSCRAVGTALSSRSSARCTNSGADSPPSRSSLGADFNSSTCSSAGVVNNPTKGHAKASSCAYLECEILLQLAELFNLGFDLRPTPVLDELFRSKHDLLGLALSFTLVFVLRVGGFR